MNMLHWSGKFFVSLIPAFAAILTLPCVILAELGGSPSPERAAEESVRIYRSPDERREASLGIPLTDWLKFGAVVEVEKEWQKDNFRGNDNDTTDDPDPQLAIELGLEVLYQEWLEAELLIAIEDDGRTHYQEVDEALVGVDLGDVGIKMGWIYLPFGVFYSHFVTGPLLEFGQTRATSFLVDYTFADDTVEVAGFIFDSDIDEKRDQNELDWGVSVEFETHDESIRLGAGYISDLAESEEEFLFDFNEQWSRRVPAWNAYGMFGYPPFEFTAEVVRALKPFKEYDKENNQPFSYNIELAYFPFRQIQFAFRIEHSEEFDGAPEWQYGVSTTWAPIDNLTFSIDYLYARYKDGFVTDDFDNIQTSHSFIALNAAWTF